MKKEISVKEFGVAGDGKTDDTAAIQAAFDSSYDVIVIPKGVYRITKALKIGSDKKIEADKNARLFMCGNVPKHRNDFLLTNSDTESGNSNIEIEGGIWDGNNQGKCNTKPDLFDKNGYSGTVLNFFNVKNLKLSDMTVANSVTYNIRMSCLDGFEIRDIRFYSKRKAFNQDGLHFGGEVRNGIVENISAISKGQTNDDLIAFNADDSIERIENLDIVRGDIENITVKNVSAEDCHTFIRLLSVDASIRNITIENISGGCRVCAVNMDAARYCKTPLFNENEKPYGAGNIENVTIRNMNVHWSSKPNRYRDALILCETVADNLSILNFKRDKSKDKAKKVPTLIVRNVPGINIDLKESEDEKAKKTIFHFGKSFPKLSVHNIAIDSKEKEYKFNGSFEQLVFTKQDSAVSV